MNNNITEPSLELKISDWELDFYSRPIIESNGKKKMGVNYLLYKKL